jgi:hypothetical protein
VGGHRCFPCRYPSTGGRRRLVTRVTVILTAFFLGGVLRPVVLGAVLRPVVILADGVIPTSDVIPADDVQPVVRDVGGEAVLARTA